MGQLLGVAQLVEGGSLRVSIGRGGSQGMSMRAVGSLKSSYHELTMASFEVKRYFL